LARVRGDHLGLANATSFRNFYRPMNRQCATLVE
jgi:hypothetical protein